MANVAPAKCRWLRAAAFVPAVLVAVTAVCWWLACSGMSFIGDDMSYNIYGGELPDGLLDFPGMVVGRFLSLNGRMGDMLNSFWLYFVPRPGLNLLCGLMMAMFLTVVMRASGARTLLSRTLLVAVACMGLTWWDGSMLFVVQINYMWGSALAVFVVMTILSRREPERLQLWAALILAFPAGAWHEMAGAPVVAGLFVWLLADRRRWHGLGRERRIMALAFAFGALVPYLSPQFWARVGGVSKVLRDDSYLKIMLLSDYPALVLAVAALVFRRHSVRLFRTSGWGVWAVAALLSMLVSPIGGIVGRSGWYSQVYGLIALWPLLRLNLLGRSKVAVTATMAVAAFVVFHNVEFVRWQGRLNAQLAGILEHYRKSPAEPVYIDIIGPDDVPLWVAGRSMQLLTNDYFSFKQRLSERLYDYRYPLLILPVEVSRRDFSALRGMVRIDDFYVADTLAVKVDHAGQFETDDGRKWVATPFTQNGRRLVLIAPRLEIPGLRPFARQRPEPAPASMFR